MTDNAPTLRTFEGGTAHAPMDVAVADGWLGLYDPAHSTCYEAEQHLCLSVPDRMGNLSDLVFAEDGDDPVEIEDDGDGWPSEGV